MKRLFAILLLVFTLFLTTSTFGQNKNSSQTSLPTAATRSQNTTMLLVGAGVALVLVGLAFVFVLGKQRNNS